MEKGRIHWTDYIGVFLIILLGVVVSALSGGAFLISVIFSTPFLYKMVGNYFKVVEVKNNLLYYKEGVLFQETREIKYSKINEIKLSQNVIQKFFGAGELVILTGNDTHTRLPCLAQISQFKQEIEKKMEAL